MRASTIAKNYQGKLIFSERREVRYPVGMFGFLKGGRSTVLSSSSAMSTDADKFSANLVVELVPLPTSASSAPFIDDGKFSADWVEVVLSIEVSNLALPKP